jgi:hypothetical protein
LADFSVEKDSVWVELGGSKKLKSKREKTVAVNGFLMNKEDTTLDERILGLPSDHDFGIIYRDEIYGAFDITERGLLVFEEHLQNITSPIIPHNVACEQVQVVFAGKPSEKYNKVSEVFNLRNPRKGRITGINIRLMTNESLASLWIDETGLYSSRSIVLLLASNYDSNLGNIRSLVKDELANIKFWYSPIRKFWDRILALLSKIPTAVYYCLFLICLFVSIFNVFTFSKDFVNKAKQERFQQVTQKFIDDQNIDPNIAAEVKAILLKASIEQTQSPVIPVMVTIMHIIYLSFVAFLVVSCLIFASYLFPRIVFEIGEGKRRHENRIWMIRFLIGSAVFCGIVVPLIIRPLILKWFS